MSTLAALDQRGGIARFSHGLLVCLGALGLVTACFLVLPFLKAISRTEHPDTLLRGVDTAAPPPPKANLPEPEEKPEEKPEEPPPELESEPETMNLTDLEFSLGGGAGGDWFIASGDGDVRRLMGEAGALAEIFGTDDLDQEPRAVYQAQPVMDAKMRKKGGGTVYVVFMVDEKGRVHDPVIQESPHPIYDRAALAAVKQWRFDPGMRGGKPVPFRTRVPITFPES